MNLIANTNEKQPLDKHLIAVGLVAKSVAHEIGCSPAIIKAAEWGGRLHDIGKADPFFQEYLNKILNKKKEDAEQADYQSDEGEQDEDIAWLLAHQQWSYVVLK